MKRIFKFLLITLSVIKAQTEYPSINIFHLLNILLAGSGYLKSCLVTLKNNPAAVNDSKLFSSSIVILKWISSQSLGLVFQKRYISTALINVNYGIFKSYDEKKNYLGTYTSSDNFEILCLQINNFPIRVDYSSKFYVNLSNHQIMIPSLLLDLNSL